MSIISDGFDGYDVNRTSFLCFKKKKLTLDQLVLMSIPSSYKLHLILACHFYSTGVLTLPKAQLLIE
jgi:hypothetical protein